MLKYFGSKVSSGPFKHKMKKKFKVDKHILIPKHAKLAEKDKQKLLQQYNISIRELPRIPKTDAAIASLNVKAGDVVKITRNSQTAKEAVFYRVVVNV